MTLYRNDVGENDFLNYLSLLELVFLMLFSYKILLLISDDYVSLFLVVSYKLSRHYVRVLKKKIYDFRYV